jgi:hypothetical protein
MIQQKVKRKPLGDRIFEGFSLIERILFDTIF